MTSITELAGDGRRRTRIQAENETRILAAALAAFSTLGYRGATVDAIAEAAGMSKTNLLYYFRSKDALYRAVLNHTLDNWLEPLRDMRADGDPLQEIASYMRRKLEMSRSDPAASRLFANEMLQGAPHIQPVLAGPLRELVAEKSAIIRGWIAAGKLAPVEPEHLIFAIWATTQHYADFGVQVAAVLGRQDMDRQTYTDAEETLLRLFLEGLRPRKG